MSAAEAEAHQQDLLRLEKIRPKVDEEVSRLLKARPSAMAGRVVRLSLEPIADRLGERWPAIAGRIRVVASAVLGRRLGATAVILPYGPLALIAVAPHRTPETVLAATAGAAAEIARFAFGGDDAGPWPTVSVADGLKGEEPAFATIALARLMEIYATSVPSPPRSPKKTKAATASSPPPPPPLQPQTSTIHAPLPDLQAISAERLPDASGPLWRPMNSAAPPPSRSNTTQETEVPILPTSPAPAPAPPLSTLPSHATSSQAASPGLQAMANKRARDALGPLWRPAADAASSKPQSEDVVQPMADGPAAQLDCDYRPVVSLVHGRVAAGLLRPKLDRGAAVLRGYALLGPQADAVDIAQLDLYCLQRATTDLADAQRQGRGVFVALSVHFETLAPTTRRLIYAGRLAAAADHSGARIAPEIVGCPPDVSPLLLEAMVAPLRPHCRMVLMRAKVDQRRFDAAVAAGIKRIGIHLGRHVDPQARQGASLVTGSMTPTTRTTSQAVKGLGLAVQRAGMRLCALGVDDDERLDMSAAAGADLVAGEAIGAAMAAPPLVGVANTPG